MNLLYGTFYLFTLKLLLIQAVCKTITIKDGEITYEYEEKEPLGFGVSGAVYKGKRIEGDKVDFVAFKVANKGFTSVDLTHETDIYGIIGEHESIPKVYKFFPQMKGRWAVLVMDLLGENMSETLKKFKHFSIVTAMRIGLDVLDVLEYMHKERKIVHNDLHVGNLAIGLNDSKVILFDFNVAINIAKTKLSPRYDIEELTSMIIKFLRDDAIMHPDYNLKREDAWRVTREQLDKIRKNAECTKALKEFKQKNRDSSAELPDYDALRNLFKTELEKHKNEPKYDKFDWQI